MGAGARRPGVGRTGASGRAVPCPNDVAPGRLAPASSHQSVPASMAGPASHGLATSDIYSAFNSSPKRAPCRASRWHQRVRGDPGQGPVLLALRRPRQPLLEHARGRRQGGQGHPDPGRPRPGAARHRVDPGLLARGKPARSACSAPCRSACPRNSGSPASSTWSRPTASSRQVFLPQHNARFATPAEDRGTAFVPFTGALDDILCIHEERTVSNDNTVRYKRLALQIPAGRHRRHYVKARVRDHEYPDGTMAASMDRDVWRDTTPIRPTEVDSHARWFRDPLRQRLHQRPVDKWPCCSGPSSGTGARNRPVCWSTHMVHLPQSTGSAWRVWQVPCCRLDQPVQEGRDVLHMLGNQMHDTALALQPSGHAQ